MPYSKRYAGGFIDFPNTTTPVDSQFLNAVESELLVVADKSTPTTQAFTGAVTATQFTATSNSGFVAQAAAGYAFRNFLLPADANPNFSISFAGQLAWGPGGASAPDVVLTRLAASVLGTTGDAFSTGPTSRTLTGSQTAGVFVDVANGISTFNSVGYVAFQSALTTDTVPRFSFGYQGTMNWGPGGATAQDTTLWRRSVGQIGIGTSTQSGQLVVYPGTTAIAALSVIVAAEANSRLYILGDGTINWGPGTSGVDASFGRMAANVLGNVNTALSTGPVTGSVTGSQTAGSIMTVAGQFIAFNASFTSTWISALTTDTAPRWLVNTGGQIQWGPGTSAVDTTLTRGGVGVLNLGTSAQSGQLQTYAGSTAGYILVGRVTTDTNLRWAVQGDGTTNWGSGSGAFDTNLYRGAASQLKTDSQFVVNSGSGMATFAASVAAFRSYLLATDTQPAYRVDQLGALTWGVGGTTATDTKLARMAAGVIGDATLCAFSTGPLSGSLTGTQAQGFFVGSTGVLTAFTSGAQTVFQVAATSDTTTKFNINYLGMLQWGPGGSTATDTTLSRSGVGLLAVGGKMLEASPAAGTGTVPTTFTPVLANGLFQRFNVTAGGAAALTIAATAVGPSATQSTLLFLRIANTGGGTITLTWNAQYTGSGVTWGLPTSVANAVTITCQFAWDGTVSKWVLIGYN